MSDLIQQLKNLKTDPRAGWESSAAKERSRVKLMEAIGDDFAPTNTVSENATSFISWNLTSMISRPIAAGMTALVLALGSWGTVGAATNSLPGDTLYSVKIATERAQLSLSSDETKAVLHSEFAGRRLTEAFALRDSDDPADEGYARSAMDAFRKELTLAETSLKNLGREESTVTVATQVNNNIGTVSTAIETSNDQQAKDATQAVSDSVVDVVVETHETIPNTKSNHELQQMFQNELMALQSRQTFDLGRVVVIENSFAAHSELEEIVNVPTSLANMRYTIALTTERMADAMDLMAAGGYRSAFEILRETRASLIGMEEQLANIEIGITNALMAPSVEEIDVVETTEEAGVPNSQNTEED